MRERVSVCVCVRERERERGERERERDGRDGQSRKDGVVLGPTKTGVRSPMVAVDSCHFE